MKVDYISDLHIDFWIKETNPQSPKFKKQLDTFIFMLKPNKHDVLIVAGDLGHYYSQDTAFLLAMKDYYNDIFVVPGNHDLYLISEAQKKKYQLNSFNRIAEMKIFCRENGIHYLDGNTINVQGRNFSGCGMHWDMTYAQRLYSDIEIGEVLGHWENIMNDANLIFQDGKDIYRTSGMYGKYVKIPSFKPLEYTEKQLERLKMITETDVMITHYGPKIPNYLPEKYKNISTTFYYFNGRETLDTLKPKFWIYGHTHTQINEMYAETNILCNPLGYPGENTYAVIKTFEL